LLNCIDIKIFSCSFLNILYAQLCFTECAFSIREIFSSKSEVIVFLFTPDSLSSKDFWKRTGEASHEAPYRSHAIVESRTKVVSDFSLSSRAFCNSITSRPATLNDIRHEVFKPLQLLVLGSLPPFAFGWMLKWIGALFEDFLGDRHWGELEGQLQQSHRDIAVHQLLVCVVHRLQLLDSHHLHHCRSAVGAVDLAEGLCPLPPLWSLCVVLVLLCFHLLMLFFFMMSSIALVGFCNESWLLSAHLSSLIFS